MNFFPLSGGAAKGRRGLNLSPVLWPTILEPVVPCSTRILGVFWVKSGECRISKASKYWMVRGTKIYIGHLAYKEDVLPAFYLIRIYDMISNSWKKLDLNKEI